MHDALEAHGFGVTLHSRGADVAGFAAEFSPDLVLLDAGLADIDGFTLCRLLRSQHAELPIVLATARDADIDIVIRPFCVHCLVGGSAGGTPPARVPVVAPPGLRGRTGRHKGSPVGRHLGSALGQLHQDRRLAHRHDSPQARHLRRHRDRARRRVPARVTVRRRITTAIIGETTFVLLVLGVPLAIIVQRSIIDSEVVGLRATIAHLLTEIKLPVNPTELATLQHEPDAPPPFGIYDKTAHRVYGVEPETAYAAVRAAEQGSTSSRTSGAIIVATALTDRSENVLIVVRVSQSSARPHSRARRSWPIMAGAGASALAIAWLLARRLAGRLTRPVADLAASAGRVGSGGVFADHSPSDMAETDLLGDAPSRTDVR